MSESKFVTVARKVLDPDLYRVTEKPKELLGLFVGSAGARPLGIEPEACIENLATGKKVFVEVKKQGKRGNAEERACKHHTTRFVSVLRELYGYDYHPFVTIFCEDLATTARYTQKIPYLIEPGHYLFWVDYDEDILSAYLNDFCSQRLS